MRTALITAATIAVTLPPLSASAATATVVSGNGAVVEFAQISDDGCVVTTGQLVLLRNAAGAAPEGHRQDERETRRGHRRILARLASAPVEIVAAGTRALASGGIPGDRRDSGRRGAYRPGHVPDHRAARRADRARDRARVHPPHALMSDGPARGRRGRARARRRRVGLRPAAGHLDVDGAPAELDGALLIRGVAGTILR